jgi:hypothetical protein
MSIQLNSKNKKMKKIKYLLTAFLLVAVSAITNAQDAKINLRNFGPKPTTATFKVDGECGSCKSRIQNALKVEGIKFAKWDEDSKLLSIQYDDRFIKLDKIHYLVAAAGHDTEKVNAKEEVYNTLPDCCHYREI